MALVAISLFIFSGALTVKSSATTTWWYGVQIVSPYSLYSDVEVTTGGQHFSSRPGVSITYWGGANTPCCFLQLGEWENGLTNTNIVTGNKTTPCVSKHWCLYFEYFDFQGGCADCGNFVIPNAGWTNKSNMDFSMSVFPAKKDISFAWYQQGQTITTIACGVYHLTDFNSKPGEIMESSVSTGFNNIMWNDSTIWAQVKNSTLSQRGNGEGTVTDVGGGSPPPNTALISYWGRFAGVEDGFNQGTHFPGGTPLWTDTQLLGLENYTPDFC